MLAIKPRALTVVALLANKPSGAASMRTIARATGIRFPELGPLLDDMVNSGMLRCESAWDQDALSTITMFYLLTFACEVRR